MSPLTDRAYGSDSLGLWWHGLRDRLHGEHARANARWGHLRPPSGESGLVWVETGKDEGGVRLALGALRALREARLDLRLVLTFEREYPLLLERGIAGINKTGFGYGPCDAPRAVRRALRALAPLGVVMAGRQPAPNLCAALEIAGVRCIALHTPVAARGHFEAVYPADAEQEQAWQASARADYIAPQADFTTLLVESQVDPNFRQVLCGATGLAIWWILGARARDAKRLSAWWTASELSRHGILLVSSADTGAASAPGWIPISAWRRTTLAAGNIVLVDETRWLPAISASSDAVHVMDSGAWPFWQALAGGCPMSVADHAFALRHIGAIRSGQAGELFAHAPGFDELERFWRAMRSDPIAARGRGDALRRLFWAERRHASEVNHELLQRVFDW